MQKTVYSGVVFLKLGMIDTGKECFTADVYIEAKWMEPALDHSPDFVPILFTNKVNPSKL